MLSCATQGTREMTFNSLVRRPKCMSHRYCSYHQTRFFPLVYDHGGLPYFYDSWGEFSANKTFISTEKVVPWTPCCERKRADFSCLFNPDVFTNLSQLVGCATQSAATPTKREKTYLKALLFNLRTLLRFNLLKVTHVIDEPGSQSAASSAEVRWAAVPLMSTRCCCG